MSTKRFPLAVHTQMGVLHGLAGAHEVPNPEVHESQQAANAFLAQRSLRRMQSNGERRVGFGPVWPHVIWIPRFSRGELSKLKRPSASLLRHSTRESPTCLPHRHHAGAGIHGRGPLCEKCRCPGLRPSCVSSPGSFGCLPKTHWAGK